MRKIKEVLEMGADEMLYDVLESSLTDLGRMTPGTNEYKIQAEVVKMLNDTIREREKYVDAEEEKSKKKTFKDWVNDINWLEVLVKYLLPAGVSIYEVRAIMKNESDGNFITTKALNFIQKPMDLFKKS